MIAILSNQQHRNQFTGLIVSILSEILPLPVNAEDFPKQKANNQAIAARLKRILRENKIQKILLGGALTELFELHPSMSSLVLQVLAQSLHGTGVFHLDLSHNYLETEVVLQFIEQMNCGTITQFNLYGNNLGVEGIAAVGEKLFVFTSVKMADFRANAPFDAFVGKAYILQSPLEDQKLPGPRIEEKCESPDFSAMAALKLSPVPMEDEDDDQEVDCEFKEEDDEKQGEERFPKRQRAHALDAEYFDAGLKAPSVEGQAKPGSRKRFR